MMFYIILFLTGLLLFMQINDNNQNQMQENFSFINTNSDSNSGFVDTPYGTNMNPYDFYNRVEIPPDPKPSICHMVDNANSPFDNPSDYHQNVRTICTGTDYTRNFANGRTVSGPRKTRFLGPYNS
jgi:hypothetical protein